VQRELFIVTAARAWATHRTLGPLLHALGAPHTAAAAPTVELLTTTVPKAGFVGEGSDIHVESYGEQVGRQAAFSETARVLGLLGESLQPSEVQQTMDRRALAERVITAIRGFCEVGYHPSFLLTPTTHAIWSRLAVDTTELVGKREGLRSAGVPEYLLRFVRAAVEGVVVISLPAFKGSSIFVIDAVRALAVPAEFDPSGEDLEIALVERNPTEVERQLVDVDPDMSDERLAALVEDQSQLLLVVASANLDYEIADARAMRMICI